MLLNLVRFCRRTISSSVIDILPEVQCSLRDKKPVVALESTIITHGMPYPVNLETATACQEVVRREGCTPAVIAILNGRVKVGLSDEDLAYLARGGAGKTVKTSRRDFPHVLANSLDGGTTVSGTVIVASIVGIKVFATGGLGGVHRKGERTMDISTDLVELGRNEIMVVSSGVKSILDIGRTLEYLETQGVLVASYKNDSIMPAFFSSHSSFKTPYKVDTPDEAASLIRSMDDMNIGSGILLAVPIPEKHSIDFEHMETHIDKALEEAEDKGMLGKEITPFLLDKISSLTKGKSLESNIALILNNCKVASKIARSYSENNTSLRMKRVQNSIEKYPVVIGGSVVDHIVTLKEDFELDGRTVRGEGERHCGGVGRNLADALGKLNTFPAFLSAVGNDDNGKFVLNSLSHIDSSSVEIIREGQTAVYTVLLNSKGDCLLCAGNSDIHDETNIVQIKRHVDKLDQSNIIVLDSNVPQEAMEFVLNRSSQLSLPVWIEPTSLLKCHKMLSCPSSKNVRYTSPNLIELKRMATYFGAHFNEDFETDVDKLLKQVLYLSGFLLTNFKSTLMVTMGKFGILMVDRKMNSGMTNARYYAGVSSNPVVNSSGAGDCVAAGFISGLLKDLPEAKCIRLAQLASAKSLLSKSPVPTNFDIEDFVIESASFTSLST